VIDALQGRSRPYESGCRSDGASVPGATDLRATFLRRDGRWARSGDVRLRARRARIAPVQAPVLGGSRCGQEAPDPLRSGSSRTLTQTEGRSP